MSTIKIIFLAVTAIIFFQFLENSNDDFDGTIMLPLDTKVLAFGDSITYGYNIERDKSYPSQLSLLLQAEVINAGINGELTQQGLKRLPALLDKYKPQILIICHGGNDILRRKNLVKTKQNISKMIEIARKKNIHVILIGVPTVEIIAFSTAEFYFDISNETGVPLESVALEEILADDTLKLDRIHPNEAGYKILSNKIANLVTQTYLPSNPAY